MKTVLLSIFDNSFQASLLQGVLNNEGIESFLKNEILSSVLGNISGFKVQIFVYEQDFERAWNLLKEGFPELVDK